MFGASYDSYEDITGVAWRYDDSLIVAISSKGLIHVVNFDAQEITQTFQYDEAPLK